VAHRAWVSRLAGDLSIRGIEIVWDQVIRESLATHCSIDPFELALCQEISRAFPVICNVFVPIITPGYLERLFVKDGQHIESVTYGVVFEECQGGGNMINQGFLDLIPIVRHGQAHLLNISQLTLFFVGGLIDCRGDDASEYEKRLDELSERILRADIFRNPLLFVDLQTWSDVYIEWCRAKFPSRAHVPVDIWWFHTGAANEFLGEVDSLIRDESLAQAEINWVLRHGGTNCVSSPLRQILL